MLRMGGQGDPSARYTGGAYHDRGAEPADMAVAAA
jgi:hypothetical protein